MNISPFQKCRSLVAKTESRAEPNRETDPNVLPFVGFARCLMGVHLWLAFVVGICCRWGNQIVREHGIAMNLMSERGKILELLGKDFQGVYADASSFLRTEK